MLKGTRRCLTRLMTILMKLLLELSRLVSHPSTVLRKSLTGKPVTSLHQLMDLVNKYKRIEDNQQQGKGKAKVIP